LFLTDFSGVFAMWLLYMRFESDNDAKTSFSILGSKADTHRLLSAAKKLNDFVLKEYATFYSSGHVRPGDVHYFAESMIHDLDAFLEAHGVSKQERVPPSS
jgi:hypothetical protein